MSNSYGRRLERLESLFVVDDGPTDEEIDQERRREQATTELLMTMAPEHVERLVNLSEHPGDEGGGRLKRVFRELVRARVQGRVNFLLALPFAVAEAYIDNRGWPFSQCRGCLLVLPYASSTHLDAGSTIRRERRQPFDACPECGGSVGWWNKWSVDGPPIPRPEEKRGAR